MINEAKNKVMDPQKTKVESLQEFSFPGGGEYQPVTIKANNISEATEIYEKEKKIINK